MGGVEGGFNVMIMGRGREKRCVRQEGRESAVRESFSYNPEAHYHEREEDIKAGLVRENCIIVNKQKHLS